MLSASTLLVWLGVSLFVHEWLLHEANEIYDGQLRQSGRTLAGIIRAGGGEIELNELRTALPKVQFDGVPQVHSEVDHSIHQAGKYERVMGFQVVDAAGALLFRSPGAPGIAFSSRADDGFSDTEIDGVQWRVCSFRDEALDQVLHVGEQYAVREEISKYLLRSMRVPVLFGILSIGILIWLSLNWGLRPLSELARRVRDRKPEDFSAVEPGRVSEEIHPIVASLNDLLARVRRSFEAERRFTGDAAHELRTPLAALRVQSQVALEASDDDERAKALAGVIASVDRATHLVNQLLDLSRLDWQQRPESRCILIVTEIVQLVASELDPFARERGIDITGCGDAGSPIWANDALISALVRNLLDNAIRYSAPGGRVTWSVTRGPRRVLLEIADTGPGIPPEERQAVFERFRRQPAGRGKGAGLGLSIVRKIVDIYGADIALGDGPAGQGLRVSVGFSLTERATPGEQHAGKVVDRA